MNSPFFVENEALIQRFLQYFSTTWIGPRRLVGPGRLPPMFSVELWNCHVAAAEDLARTNNHVESWHKAFSYLINGDHPSLFTFLEKLKQEQVEMNTGLKDILRVTNRQRRKGFRRMSPNE